MRQAGLDGGLARAVLPAAGAQYVAEDHLVDLGGIQPGLFQQAADHRRAQCGGWRTAQAALETADGGTGGGDDDDILHDDVPVAMEEGADREDWPGLQAPALPGVQKVISRTAGEMRSRPAVFSTISSMLTPGAGSCKMKLPSSMVR